MEDTKIFLSEKEMPQKWYNINPDLPAQLPPPLHPGTGKPVGPQDLAPLFPMEVIKQEMSMEPWIEIPDDVLKIYKLWRPSPLHRARRLEKALKTPARIYFKNESVSPAGSHKPNTAVAQAYYNKQEGVKNICTETGAGQWGSALAFACQLFGIECKVYMVKVSYEQKPYRKMMMQTWGAKVFASPSNLTEAGRKILAEDPESTGSLGVAISEAVEDAVKTGGKYSLGSVLNHVLLHQTIIGLEVQKQLKIAGEKTPDILIACTGGGSNFGGFAFPFIPDKLKGKKDIRIIAVEPASCPSLTKGLYAYDFGDSVGMTPLIKMCTLGHAFRPAPIHAGGLRYHGMAAQVSLLAKEGVIEARSYKQNACFEAAVLFARTEGFLPAPETSHAIKAAIDEAIRCRETGEEKCIVFNYSGHGHFDLNSYDKYLAGQLNDLEYSEAELKESLSKLPKVNG
ncbi:MAG: TrpB-like pyridoxal phosphate-dependent enzyme [Elusimicrobiota bacterium]